MGAWNKAKPLDQRFFEKLEKLESGCWSSGSGHDRMYAKLFYQGKQLHGHRGAWLIHVGEIPEGLFVCHNCPGGDNRWCVNPDHLFLGTLQDNNEDRDIKGRTAISNATISVEIASQIRNDSKQGATRKQLMIKYQLSYNIVTKVVTGQTWATAPG